MTRSEFDDIRAHITAEADRPGDLLEIAHSLLDDLEQVRRREALLRSHYLRLLTAARASVAAERNGDPDPLVFLKHELGRRGQLPAEGEQAHRVLADACTAMALMASLEQTPRRRTAPSLRRCIGPSRSLPR
ncbi:hypothetical protein AB0K60_35770 [Thermopolyspora sp. NPDC052614]|uniref:hypothetical protein n=1 Tax=Thermopolyspora sp. NPDC052614 TaxID=3155682 RepID=UPI00342A2256